MREPGKRAKVTCPHCGGDEFVDGMLRGHYLLRFVPTWRRWFRASPGVEVTACRSCGHLGLWVDPEAMQRVLTT